jgi:RimJ/RimL family protein N-acetyltransferase
MRIHSVALEGALVHLEPLEARHLEATVEAALSAPDMWTYYPFPVRDRADVQQRFFDFAAPLHAAGTGVVYATCVGPDRRVVGGTSIRIDDPLTPSVEIGRTWLVPAWQRTVINTEAKLLQLTHCFEELGITRVELKTDARNLRSRAAMRRIGATEEGTLRRHMRLHDGTLRDSVFFSIVADEWPTAKARLVALVEARR